MLQSVSFCSITNNAPTPGVFALISSSVRRLHFPFESYGPLSKWNEPLRNIFSQACLAAPEVAELQLTFPPSRLGSALIPTHCSSVRRIQVDTQLDIESVSLLAQFPALEYLSISLSPLASPGSTLPFSSLATLALSGSWDDLCTLLQILRLPLMRTLSVTSHENGKPAAELAAGTIKCF